MTVTPTRSAFGFIIMTLLLDAMGIGLIIPVMPDLIQDVQGGTLGSAAIWGGVLTTLFAVMQFLFGPTLGALSDRYGRRPILLISLAVMTLNYLVLGAANTIWLILIFQILNGIASATQSTAMAFIADISKPEKKSANFGLVGAAFGLGFVLGPVIGGFLSGYGTRAPFHAAAILAALNLTIGLFVLPETVTENIRRRFEIRRANPFGAFKVLSKMPDITRLLMIVFIYEFAFIVYPATWAYFTREQFGWDGQMVGVSLGMFGISMAVVQGVLIRVFVPKFGERKTITLGLLINFAAFVFLGVVQNGTLALLFTPLTALGAIVTPALIGLLSQRVPDDQQGELQGIIASAKAMALIFSPLVMTQIFWRFTDNPAYHLPGAPFLLSAVLVIACLFVFLTRRRQAVATS